MNLHAAAHSALSRILANAPPDTEGVAVHLQVAEDLGGPEHMTHVANAVLAVGNEVEAQVARWGVQRHRDRLPNLLLTEEQHLAHQRQIAEQAKRQVEQVRALGYMNWESILMEEVCELMAESPALDNENFDAELVQVAAVCISQLASRAARRASAATWRRWGGL